MGTVYEHTFEGAEMAKLVMSAGASFDSISTRTTMKEDEVMAEYQDMTVEELESFARDRNIPGRSGLNKNELVDLHQAYDRGEFERGQDSVDAAPDLATAWPDYDPDDDERTQNFHMGMSYALQAVQSAKSMAGGNPQYDPAIEYLSEEVDALDQEMQAIQQRKEAEADSEQ